MDSSSMCRWIWVPLVTRPSWICGAVQHLDDLADGAVQQRLAAANKDHRADLRFGQLVGEPDDAVLAYLAMVQHLGADALGAGEVADGRRVEVDDERRGQSFAAGDVEGAGVDGTLVELADEVEVALHEEGAESGFGLSDGRCGCAIGHACSHFPVHTGEGRRRTRESVCAGRGSERRRGPSGSFDWGSSSYAWGLGSAPKIVIETASACQQSSSN